MRWLHFLIALGIFTLDQLTKALVEARIPLHDDRAIVPGFFRLTHVKNRGAAFGIFAESPWPKIWLLILLSAYLTPGVSSLIIVLTITSWAFQARQLRSQALSVRSRDFLVAARVRGERPLYIILVEIVPTTAASAAPRATTSSSGPTRAEPAATRARSAGALRLNAPTIAMLPAAARRGLGMVRGSPAR